LVKEELGIESGITRADAKFLGVFEHFYQNNVFNDEISTHYIVHGYEILTNCTILEILPKFEHQTYSWFGIKDLNDKEKLFNIRRRIAETFKENAKGENCIWPFRLEGVLIKEHNKWVFKYLQFTFPFNYILEGKTEAASLIKKK